MDIPSIKITRTDTSLVLKAVMPVWPTTEEDCSIRVDIPLLQMSISVSDESEIEPAVNDAVHAFFWAAEKHGEGFEKEIVKIGWSRQARKKDIFNLTPPKNDVVFNGIMKTGHSQLVSMSI